MMSDLGNCLKCDFPLGFDGGCHCTSSTPTVTIPREVLERVREAVKPVLEHYEERTDGDNAPGHGHLNDGVWDLTGNPVEIAGKPCLWCAQWAEFRAAIAALEGMG